MRPQWTDLPEAVRKTVEALVGGAGRVDACPDGFSPGFAVRLTRADGQRRFVKGIDADAWPHEVDAYRTEARIGEALPPAVPAPRLRGVHDDGHWCVLAFDDVDGRSPGRPWTPQDIRRVVGAIGDLARAATPSPVPLPTSHPRLGGWSDLAADSSRLSGLRWYDEWAAANVQRLAGLERSGLEAARGESLVHGDLYPHNILLTGDRVVFVDWPHARRGSPVIDLVTFLSSVAADGIDPEPFLPVGTPETATTAILAAHTGFLLAGGLAEPLPGLERITAEKLRLGRGAFRWLRTRL
ncbi:phosphotransferase [Dactylosporangium sp. CA-152071]|uniref:phosphotransferase n=1 Tax=Dactylosporangium sp. CA-152071 TaxID=3239933 RepID=UPI003D93A87E